MIHALVDVHLLIPSPTARTDAGNHWVSFWRKSTNWDYSVDGSAEFKPEVMFDDGHSMWMRMPA